MISSRPFLSPDRRVQNSWIEQRLWRAQKNFPRRLEVSRSGKWYLALTIALGVVALVSGNNSIYLMESILLSGLTLSGLVSESAIKNLQAEWKPRSAHAGRPTCDSITLSNPANSPVHAIEILCEFEDDRGRLWIETIAFVAEVPARSSVTVSSNQVFQKRGTHFFTALLISTRAPFGFARKSKVFFEQGNRLIWPERTPSESNAAATPTAIPKKAQLLEIEFGEVRPWREGEDLRRVAWGRSALGNGLWMRPQSQSAATQQMLIDLDGVPIALREATISAVTETLCRDQGQSWSGLKVRSQTEWYEARGLTQSLDLLAKLP
jgi:uncharacterized protein (DUF58 family)